MNGKKTIRNFKNVLKLGLMVVLVLSIQLALASYELSRSSSENTRQNFTLKEANGSKTFTLSEAKGKYVALHFLLKTTCGFCLRHTHEYAYNAEAIPGVIHIFIKPDTEQEIQEWYATLEERTPAEYGEEYKLPTIYHDPDAQLAKSFDIPFGYEFHDQVVHYPGLVLLDPDSKEVFRYVGKSNRDRYVFEKFKAKIAELKGKNQQNY